MTQPGGREIPKKKTGIFSVAHNVFCTNNLGRPGLNSPSVSVHFWPFLPPNPTTVKGRLREYHSTAVWKGEERNTSTGLQFFGTAKKEGTPCAIPKSVE